MNITSRLDLVNNNRLARLIGSSDLYNAGQIDLFKGVLYITPDQSRQTLTVQCKDKECGYCEKHAKRNLKMIRWHRFVKHHQQHTEHRKPCYRNAVATEWITFR